MFKFKSLNTKLSLLLLTLFVFVGVLLGFITRYATVQYNLEITQRLNESIASYVAAEEPLIIDGQYNEKALKRLAHQSMVINPTVEVYLLNTKGEILSFSLPPETVVLDKVPLGPIQKFLQQGSKRPLLNEDPRSPNNNKTFSVAKVIYKGKQEGYIYVVLGGKKYEELANNLSKNYIMQLSLAGIVAVILLVFLMGSLMLTKLTRPLKQLRDKVIDFQSSSNENTKNYQGDEIQQLNQAFDDMSKRIEYQLQQIKNADKTRRDLITNVSHDLRTPLASMQGYLDTLIIKQDSMDAATTKQFLSISRKHCGRLGLLINDLFELSKLDSNVIKPQLESFSMAELLQDVGHEFIHQAEEKNVSLEMDLIQGNTNVHADIGLIQRVLENLIGNAIKNTPEDGVVCITLTQQNAGFQVIIKDTGRGISEHELPHIFDRLYQAENSSQDSSSSSGLGLAIVKKILDIHHAQIKVKSQLNFGTEFSFVLI